MKKKLLSLALALTLCLGLLPVTALAAPQSSYTSPTGVTIHVTPLPDAMAGSHHKGEGIFVKKEGSGDSAVYLFYDVNGNQLGSGSGYDLSGKFHNGLMRVKAYDPYTAEDSYGYIDRTGKLVIPAQFQDARDFGDGLACVTKDRKQWFYIDTAGNRAISQEFNEIYTFADGVAAVMVPSDTQRGPRTGGTGWQHCILIDKSGNTIFEFPEKEIDDTGSNGYPSWHMEDTMHLVENGIKKGEFRYGQLAVQDENDRVYLMDKTGARRALPELDELTAFEVYLGGDTFMVSKLSKMAILSVDGTMLLPYLYGYMQLSATDDFKYGVARLTKGGLEYNVIDSRGNMIMSPDWTGHVLDEFVDGMAVGDEYDYTNGVKQIYYLFWVEGSPYAPGASTTPGTPSTPSTPSTPAPATPTPAPTPAPELAYASTQNVLVDGKSVEFQCYALKDANGNDTNYIKLRDVAQVLNGTAAQFQVGWDGSVNILTGQPYTPNGSEMKTPFSGNRSYTVPTAATKVNGADAALDAIVLTDDSGSGYTYYKLRDLGTALGFTVDWSADKGIFIETN